MEWYSHNLVLKWIGMRTIKHNWNLIATLGLFDGKNIYIYENWINSNQNQTEMFCSSLDNSEIELKLNF